jgi:transposase InsO family protein
MALAQPENSARQLAWLFTDQEGYFVSESRVLRLLERFDVVERPGFQLVTAADRLAPWPAGPGRAAHSPGERTVADRLHLLQDPGLRLVPWTASWAGYLSTVLDDYSRYIPAWQLTPTMAATDVQETLELALARAKLDRVRVRDRSQLLLDNGPCHVSGELRRFLESHRMEHTRGAPYHPKAPSTLGVTQGKIERYHRSMRNRIQWQNNASPWDLEREIGRFVDSNNRQRYHQSLDSVTPADVYFGRVKEALSRREDIKRQTLEARRRRQTHSLRIDALLSRPQKCVLA